MANDEVKMSIRLSPELHKRLSEAAHHDRRSMHAQMLHYVERGVATDERKATRPARKGAA
jgi:predicted transcriptional regulator